MKTNFLIYSLLLLFALPTYGQKLKDKRVSFKYVSLPSEQLPEDYKTYSVNVYGSNLANGGLNAGKMEESIKMYGFKKLAGTQGNHGHLRVSVNTGYTTTGTPEFKSRTDTKKDKEGNETKTTYYWYEFPFSTSGSYSISAPDGTQMDTKNVGFSKTLKTSESTSSASVRKEYGKYKSAKRKEFARSAASNAVKRAQSVLSKRYDFNHTRESHKFYWIKKHKTEAEFKKHFDTVLALYGKTNAGTPSSEYQPKLQAAIDFWKEQASNDPGGDKKLKRICEAANHNLAVTHLYYLDDLDAAKQYAEAVMKIDSKNKHAKNILSEIAAAKKSMAMHDIHTMHYTRDVADAIGPAKVKELEKAEELAVAKEQMAAAAAAKTSNAAGNIYINGEKLSGSMVLSDADEALSFGDGGNISFTMKDGEKDKKYDLTSEEISAFEIGERSFAKKNFTPKAKGKSEMQKHILEEIYASGKITLYKYHPSSGAMGDEKIEYAYQKKADEQPVSLYDTQFLILKKGLANYFSDCADLKEMCSEGAIKLNEEDLIKAARIYSELCE